MPRIPPPYQQVIQPDLVRPQAIGMAGQSMRELAQTSGEVGNAFVKLRMAQQEANDATWLSESMARAEKDTTTAFDEFTKANADAPEGKAEAFQTQMRDYYNGLAANAPSTRAKRLFAEQARNLEGNAFNNAFRWQNSQMVKNFSTRLDNVQADLSTLAMRTSDPAKLADIYKQVDAATIAGSTFIGTEELEKLNRNMKASVAQGFLEGAVSKNPLTVQKAIDNKAFDGILEPNQQMAYYRSAKAELKRREAEARARQAVARANTMEQVKGALAGLSQGQNVDVGKINLSALPEDKRAEVQAALADAQDFAGAFNQIRYDDVEGAQALIAEKVKALETTAPEDYKSAQKEVATLQRAFAQRQKALNADPFTYVSQSPAVQEIADQLAVAPPDQQPALQQQFAATMVAEQQRLGVPFQNVSLLPKPTADAIVASLSNPNQTSEQVVSTVRSLQSSYGQYYPYVQQQLAKAGMPTHLEVVAARAPQNAMMGQKLLQAVANQKAIKEIVGTKAGNEIEQKVMDSMAPLARTLKTNPNGTDKLASYASTAKLLAMQYVADGKAPDDAATQAASEVVMGEYSFEPTYRIPNRYEAQVRDIRAQAERALKQVVQKGDFDLPRTDMADLVVARRLAEEDMKAQAYWVTTADDTGLMLYHPSRGPVTYNRKPIKVTFDQLGADAQAERARRKKERDSMPGGPNAFGIYN